MNRISDPTTAPNAGPLGVGFVYKDPESGAVFVHASVDHLAVLAKKHRTANNYPIGSNWSQDFIDNVCRNTPGRICFDEPPPSAGEKAVSLARALYESARGGFKTLTPEQLQDRRTICEASGPGGTSCQFFRGVNGLFDVACGLCGCTKLKMHLKTSQCPKGLWPEL